MFLNQLFLGLVHIFIYVGGVAVLAAFAYMTSISVEEVEESRSPFKFEGAVIAILSGIAVFFAGYKLIDSDSRAKLTEVNVYEIARSLIKERLLEFELVSVLLIVSLIASLALVRRRHNND
jgi:NADH:ubiquinone oxidoreductase subunit 6 (subunit J)